MNTFQQAEQFFAVYADWIGLGLKPVAPEEAQRRADICAACPMNRDNGLWDTCKLGIATGARFAVEIKNELKLHVRNESNLHTCSVCNCILTLKIHVPAESIVRKMKQLPEEFPEPCWIREIL